MNLIPSTNEAMEWGLNDVFFTGYNFKYEIEGDQSVFTVRDPVSSVGSSKTYAATVTKIVGADAYTS